METGKQTASMAAWKRIPATEQVEIIARAARRAVYIAGAYGVVLTVDEIIGQTWENMVKRLDADRLSKANAKRTAKGKAPLNIMQIANRAAHAAVELWRYDYNKHGDVAPAGFTAEHLLLHLRPLLYFHAASLSRFSCPFPIPIYIPYGNCCIAAAPRSALDKIQSGSIFPIQF